MACLSGAASPPGASCAPQVGLGAEDQERSQDDSSLPALPEAVESLVGRDAEWRKVSIGCSAASVYRVEHTKPEEKLVEGKEKEAGETKLEVAYLKIDRAQVIAAEAERMHWLGMRRTTPKVLAHHEDQVGEEMASKEAKAINTDRRGYLLTTALGGIPSYQVEKGLHQKVAMNLATALRELHQEAVLGCPFDFRLAKRLQEAKSRVLQMQVEGPARVEEYKQVVRQLEEEAPNECEEDLVVLHGDFCLPNVIVSEADGTVIGMLDLGHLGIGDRHHDIALLLWSLRYNFGEGPWRQLVQEAYGRDLCQEKLDYYTRLEDALE